MGVGHSTVLCAVTDLIGNSRQESLRVSAVGAGLTRPLGTWRRRYWYVCSLRHLHDARAVCNKSAPNRPWEGHRRPPKTESWRSSMPTEVLSRNTRLPRARRQRTRRRTGWCSCVDEPHNPTTEHCFCPFSQPSLPAEQGFTGRHSYDSKPTPCHIPGCHVWKTVAVVSAPLVLLMSPLPRPRLELRSWK